MPRGAQPKVAERENRMTYAAIRLFLENGYERTTTAAIAQAAGMFPAAFFAVFANKEALLLKLTKWMYEKQFAVTHELLGKDYDPVMFYAVEPAIQLYIAEKTEGLRELYVSSYSHAATANYIHQVVTDKLVELFGKEHPGYTRQDFYELELATSGMLRSFMARKCDRSFTMEPRRSSRRPSARARPWKLPDVADFSYIVLDLEWNQPLNPDSAIREPFFFDSEIIEIEALRLDERFRETGSFKTFIRPRFYPHMNGDVVQLTKIRAQDLEKAPEFPRAYADFMEWCGENCCLCTWGPDDIPVLMDNLLMHGMDAEMPCCYDLQRIFGHEIMRDDRQCSLERAMELLKLTPDRAHDALNDARNTVQICGRMDLDGCMDEYGLRYVQYPQDRAAGLVQGRVYASLAQGQEDPAMTEVQCPYCGETVTLGQWARKDPRTLLAYGRCSQEDELCGIYRHTRTAAGLRLGRMVLEMNDDLWDTYQTCLERQG